MCYPSKYSTTVMMAISSTTPNSKSEIFDIEGCRIGAIPFASIVFL